MSQWNKILNMRENSTAFNELLTVQRNNQIQVNGSYGLSGYRDEVIEVNSGTVSNANAEFKLSYTGSNDLASLSTSERGRYVPGHPAEAGIGARFPKLPSGDIEAIVGYFDLTDTNDINEGATFEYDSNGMYVALYHNGTQRIRIHESDFNINPNPEINYDKGWIYQINFIYYGYGDVTFQVMNPYTNEVTRLHKYVPENETTFFNSNLKISSLLRGTTSDTYDLYISGRQFSIIGTDEADKRQISHNSGTRTLSSDTWTTITSVKKKDGMEAVNLSLEGFEARTNPNLRYEIRVNPDLDGTGTWETPTRHNPNEVGIEVNDSGQVVDQGTSTPTGYKVANGLISGADNRNSLVLADEGLDINIPDDYVVSLLIYNEGTSGDAEFIFKVIENR